MSEVEKKEFIVDVEKKGDMKGTLRYLESLKGGALNVSEFVHLRKIFYCKVNEFGRRGEWGSVQNETIAEFLTAIVGIPYGLVNDPSKNRLNDNQIRVLWEKYERESEML